MHILITGGGGFIGQKLARKLAEAGALRGQAITGLTLIDLVEPTSVDAPFPMTCVACDIRDRAAMMRIMAPPPDVIFHLAAVVSGAAEEDFDLGMAVNLTGTMVLFEAVRAAGNRPVVVFSSSIAVHGGSAPTVITDGVELNPQNSYGTQKVIGELLLNDMSRRGFMDGRGLRLAAVSIRPGRANAAASGFMSSIFRDTMQGGMSNCPVGPEFEVWHSAPRTVVSNLIHGAEIDGGALGPNRCLNLPGRTDTIGAMIAAMTEVAGPEPAARITWNRDPVIERIVTGWRNQVVPTRALDLGFVADRSFAENVRWFLQDDIAPAAP